MMLKLISILVIAMFFIASPSLLKADEDRLGSSSSRTNKLEDAPEQITKLCSAFFTDLIKGNVEGAFDKFLEGSPLKDKSEEINTLKNQAKRSFKLYGKLQGYELASIENATNSYTRVRFLGLNEEYPMRWIFTFYKSPKKGWIVTNIKLDDLSEYYFSD